jgi:hypothetical protein
MNGLGDEEAYLRDPNADDRSYYGAVHSAAVIMDNARISATFSRVCLASRSAKFSRRAPAAMATCARGALRIGGGFLPVGSILMCGGATTSAAY